MKTYRVRYYKAWDLFDEGEEIEAESKTEAQEEMLNMIMDNICFYIDVEAEEIECEEND